MARLAILCVDRPTESDRNLLALAHLLGVDAECVDTAGWTLPVDTLEARLRQVDALAVSAATLCTLEDDGPHHDVVNRLAGRPLAGFLVFGYESDSRHTALARRLTGSSVTAVESVRDGGRCSFPGATRTHTGQLAGCDFARDPSGADCCFQLEAGSAAETLMEVGGSPALVRTLRDGVPWFHWAATDAIANPNAVTSGDALSRRCDRFVPPIVFLRATCPDSCWHNPLKTARIIIDDPLLAPRYGFLRYRDLLQSATRLGFGVTTAFIPWNHERTTSSAASFFRDQAPAHSVCIHGCDHTNNEFGIADEDTLGRKAVLALDRMQDHQRRTGITFDRVMVFPQGEFSAAAMRALRRAGFLAVVNSTRLPSLSSDGAVTLGEELLPATNRFSGLPVFARRYPRQLSDFALDLFLGKPAHVVEHHDWFADGCGALERCVRFLAEAEPNLAWPPLGDGLRSQHLRRRGPDGRRLVRFFTPTFEFESPEGETCSFLFSKEEPDPGLVDRVTVNGDIVEFGYEDGFLTFQYELQPRQRAVVELTQVTGVRSTGWAPGLKYRSQVRLRRALSELRDNHLARHPGLLRAAKHAVRVLGLSSEGRART